MKIVDIVDGTTEVPLGSDGELCIAGPQVMKGYWNRDDETAIALRKDVANPFPPESDEVTLGGTSEQNQHHQYQSKRTSARPSHRPAPRAAVS